MARPDGFGGRDYPDFGVTGLENSKVNITDLSELAVRMGGINRFDRLGTVLFQEAFQYGLGMWYPRYDPVGCIPTLSALYYSTLPYSIKCITIDNIDDYSGISLTLPVPYTSVMGFEVHFKVIGTTDFLDLRTAIYTGNDKYRMHVKIKVNPDEISIYNPDEGYDAIHTKEIYYDGSSPFHVLKVVADIVSGNYSRLVFDGIDYIITDYPLYSVGSEIWPHLSLHYNLENTLAASQTVYIDNVIITMNEPN